MQNRGPAKRVRVIDQDGNEQIFESVKLAAESINCQPTQVCRSIRIQKPLKGYTFQHVTLTHEEKVLESVLRDKEINARAREWFKRPVYQMGGGRK